MRAAQRARSTRCASCRRACYGLTVIRTRPASSPRVAADRATLKINRRSKALPAILVTFRCRSAAGRDRDTGTRGTGIADPQLSGRGTTPVMPRPRPDSRPRVRDPPPCPPGPCCSEGRPAARALTMALLGYLTSPARTTPLRVTSGSSRRSPTSPPSGCYRNGRSGRARCSPSSSRSRSGPVGRPSPMPCGLSETGVE